MAYIVKFTAFLIAFESATCSGTVNLLLPMHETEKLLGKYLKNFVKNCYVFSFSPTKIIFLLFYFKDFQESFSM